MAILSKEDRINISAKLTGLKEEKALSDATIATLDAAKAKAQSRDDSNKKLVDSRTIYINAYQKELKYLDGNVRTELTENVILDSVNKVKNNSFFPVDPQTPLPSLPTGVWVNFIPYSKTHAIGRTNMEVYSSTIRKETDIIGDITAKIGQIEAQIIATRATGKECGSTGTCSLPAYTTQSSCTTNGGTWTGGPDGYTTSTTISTYLTDLKNLVQEWEDMLNNEKNQIPTDPNTTRATGNTNSINDINDALLAINTWQSFQDFDTTTSLPSGSNGSGCSLFGTMVESNFQQAKLQPTTLLYIKNELTARTAYIAIRISELTGSNYLGSITQNLSTGALTSTSGLYGERIYFLDMRINLLSGSLSEVVGLQNSSAAQEQLKVAANNTETGLSLVMKATKASAPGIDTKYINLESLSGFSVNDRIYVVADNQEELSGSILEITGNRAKLTFNIPKKYTTDNNTRLYKVLE